MENQLDKNYYQMFNDIIAIHYHVNIPINFNLIPENFTKIIFSNYKNIRKCIKTNNNPFEFGEISKFNQPLILTENLTQLHFGISFDQPVNLPNSLTHLYFGEEFDKSIDLPNGLIYLYFGEEFNQPVQLINNFQLTHLTFGYMFNQPIQLPNSLTHLELGFEFSQQINLPNITHLKFFCNIPYLLNNLPNSLKKLVLGESFNLALNNLPNSIEHIEILNWEYNERIDPIPLNLTLIKCPRYFKYLNQLNEYKLEVNENLQIYLI